MEFFHLLLKMLHTFHSLHGTILEDFKHSDFDTNLSKSQRRVIMHLYEEGSQTMSLLCTKTELQKGSMTSVIDGLEKTHLVQRERNQSDRRELLINLTQEGVCIAEELKLKMNNYLEEKLRNLTSDDIRRISEILDELMELNHKIVR